MQREMATMMDRMDLTARRRPLEAGGEDQPPAAWVPSVDIIEDQKEYLVKAELPEVEKDQIKVEIHDHTLSIKGERKAETEEKGKKYTRIERIYGMFERGFILPDDADPAKITSEFKDGVLNVHLPKVPGTEPKSIEVKVS